MKKTINTGERFHYFNVIVVSTLSAIFVAIWLFSYEYLNNIIWNNQFVQSNRWFFFVLALFFSLVVGLSIKYLQAPTCLDGSLLDSMSGGNKTNYKLLPSTVLISLASLLSGAVVGPEGAIGQFSVSIATWFNQVFKIPKQYKSKIIYSSLASAYNGLIESPIFTAVLSNDISENKKQDLSNMPSNLIAGTIGYFIFTFIDSPGLTNYLYLNQLTSFKAVYIIYVIFFSLIGIALGIYMGIIFKVMAKLFFKFNNKIILRSLIAGIIFGVVGYFFPVVMFSGETQIHTIVADPLKYGVAVLLFMAFTKLTLLGVAFKSGFLGGPTFPAIFAATAVALAINIVFPQIPLALLLAGMLPGILMIIFKTPFMVILLTAIFLSADTNLIALIIVAVATTLIVTPTIESKLKRSK